MTSEQRKIYNREYYARNRDKLVQQARDYRERNLEKAKASVRASYRRNIEQRRSWQREYNATKRDEIRVRRMLKIHGLRPENWAALWAAQDGHCYLCGKPLTGDDVKVDHDHSHCPYGESCRICQRGLACSNCNVAIGMANDDPAQLRRMADALEAAQLVVEQRKAAAGQQQLTLMEVAA